MKTGLPFRRVSVALVAIAALLLQACTEEAPPARPQLDLAAVALPFPKPALEPLDTLSGVPALPATARAILDLRRAFFARDFARLDGALLKWHEDYLAGLSDLGEPEQFVDSLEDTRLAGIDACAEWLQAMPTSYPAHWVCGAMWNSGAWDARSEKSASEVGYARFAIMGERLQRANGLLEKALGLHPKPLQALLVLADNHFLGGKDDVAEQYLQKAEQIMPRHLPIHVKRLNYILPEWGGSPEAVQAEFERIKGLGVDEEGLLYLEDQFIARPWKLSTPGAPRAYWEQAIRKHPTKRRLSGLLADFVDLSNWSEALPVADRLIAAYPDDRKAYYQRATVNEHLGRIPEARQDYRTAAAMGHDLALQAVMMAFIRGGLGVDKSFDGALELCRYGATLGSKVGANCLGAMYSEGGRGGVNFRNDHAQSLAWHLVGARAGHFNSQYDLGWFLFTGRGAGMDKTEAKTVGTFWLRRAAEQDHQFAGRKLAENELPLSEEPTQEPLAEGWMGYAKLIFKVLVALIPGLH